MPVLTLELGPNVVSIVSSIVTVAILYITQRLNGKKTADALAEKVKTSAEILAEQAALDAHKKDEALHGIHVLVNGRMADVIAKNIEAAAKLEEARLKIEALEKLVGQLTGEKMEA